MRNINKNHIYIILLTVVISFLTVFGYLYHFLTEKEFIVEFYINEELEDIQEHILKLNSNNYKTYYQSTLLHNDIILLINDKFPDYIYNNIFETLYKDRYIVEVINEQKQFGALNTEDLIYNLKYKHNELFKYKIKWTKEKGLYYVIWKSININNEKITLLKFILYDDILKNTTFYENFYTGFIFISIILILLFLLLFLAIRTDIHKTSTIKKITETISIYNIELKNRQILLDAISNNIHDFIWFKDTEGKYKFINNNSNKFYDTDVSFDMFYDKSEYELLNNIKSYKYNKHLLKMMIDTDEYVLTNKVEKEFQVKWIATNNDIRTYNVLKKPIFNNNELIGIIGIISDITNEEEIKQELDYEKSLWQTSFDISPDMIFIISNTGEIKKINTTALNFYNNYGFKNIEDNYIIKDLLDFSEFELIDNIRNTYSIYNIYDFIDNKLNIKSLNYDIYSKLFNKYFKIILIKSDVYNDIKIIILRDITSQINSAKENINTKNQLEQILNIVPNHIYVKDDKLKYVLVNNSLVNFFGETTKENVLGKTEFDFSLLTIDTFSTINSDSEKTDIQLLKTLSKSSMIETKLDSLGQKYIFETSKVTYKNKDNKSFLIGVSTDVTQLYETKEHLEQLVAERTESLRIKNEELDQFTYALSHDLKKPIRDIKLLCEDIIKYNDLKFLQENISDIFEVARQAAQTYSMLEGLTVLCGVANKSDNFKCQLLNLSEIVEDAMSSLDDINIRNHKFICQPNIQIYANTGMIELLIQNLITNAWKYSIDKPETLIEFGEYIEDNIRIFYIKDNGRGINESAFNDIFKPFFRNLSDDERRKYPGDGIGLATVLKIIKKHQGTIWVESEVGVGTVFKFTIGIQKEDCNET